MARPITPPRALGALLAAGLLLAALSPALLPAPIGAQVHRFEFDGFAVELRETFMARCDSAWNGIEAVIENTGRERLELDLAISTTVPGSALARRVAWSTVVSPGSADAPAVRRQLVPYCSLAEGASTIFIGATLEVSRGGSRLEPRRGPPGELQLAREQHWVYGGSRYIGSGQGRWFSWGNFHALVVAAGEEPAGWRAALEAELVPELRTSGSNDETVSFRNLPAEALPAHPEAYEGIDRVVLIGISPDRLSEGQRTALRSAVRLGLRVWIIPDEAGAGNEWVWSPALLALPPRTMAIMGGGDAATRPHFLAGDAETGTVRDSDSVTGEELPISVEYPEGAGAWLRATSPVGPWRFAEEPVEDWGERALSRWLVEGAAAGGYDTGGNTEPGAWIGRIDSALRRTVDPAVLLGFVVIYLLVAGPGLFIWLKRKGRLPRLLWMQPLVVAVFLAGTGLLGWVHFGVASRNDEAYVLYLREGQPGGRLLRLTSIYSAVSSRRDLAAGTGSLPVPVPAAARSQPLLWRLDGGERRLAGFRTRTWSLSHAASGIGHEIGTVHVRVVTGGWTEVENGLPFPIRAVAAGDWDPTPPRDEVVPPRTTISVPRGSPTRNPGAPSVETPWDGVRRELWNWPHVRSDLEVRCVAEFDPADLPAELFPDRSDEARGFIVVLDTERGNR